MHAFCFSQANSNSRNSIKKLFCVVVPFALAFQAHAATIQFDLQGRAGAGLLGGNENGPLNGTPGSGGEVGSGIFFDDSSLMLTINVAWGSANGFTDLTGNTIAGHLHGPTASGGTAAFTQNANVKYPLNTLPGWNNSASAGGYNGTISILAGDVPALLNGQFYFNAHTSLNSGGEIRGNLVPVPEPGTWSLLGLAACGLLWVRRARQN